MAQRGLFNPIEKKENKSSKSENSQSDALLSPMPEALIQEVLQLGSHPDRENLEKLKPLIKQNYQLIFGKGSLVESYSKREWPSISLLQLAAWTGDKFMLEGLLSFVPKDLHKKEIAEQLTQVLESKEHGGYLAPYKTLITLHKELCGEYKNFMSTNNLAGIDSFWINKIGSAQKLLPLYGLQVYCDSTGFNPPTFANAPRRLCKVKDSLLDIGSLGETIAIYKNTTCYLAKAGDFWAIQRMRKESAELAITAFENFCETRKRELEEMIKKLENELSLTTEVSAPSLGIKNYS